MSNILIKNATIVTMTGQDKVIENGEIAVQNGKILTIGATGTISKDFYAEKIIDARGMVAFPGLINCHTHAAMTLLRSYADDMPLKPWLNEKIWPYEENLTADDVYWGTMLCILEMIKSGTTTFLDMYFFMQDVAKAVEETGIRAVLSRGMVGFNPNALTALAESKELTLNWQGAANNRITTLLAPHATDTCPPEFFTKVIQMAEELKVGINIHVAESLPEIETINKEYGKTPVQFLNDLGLFNHPTIAAHCVHLTDEDISILKAKDVRVAHNPESNMKLASGIAPIPKLVEQGIIVGFGTDGSSSNNNQDLLEEMHTGALLHKVNTMNPTVMPAYKSMELATIDGAKVLRLDNEIGSLEVGKKADIILVDFEAPHLYPKYDVYAHMVYSANSADVKTVIIDGKIVMENRQIIALDEEKIMHEADKRAKVLAQKAQG